MSSRLLGSVLGASAALVGVAISGGAAQAATVTMTQTFDIPSNFPAGFQTTNFSETLTVNQFDPSLGTLTSVAFNLDAGVQGSAGAESQDAAPTTLTLTLGADVSLVFADTSGFTALFNALLPNLASAFPSISESEQVTAFDGLNDNAGTSGFSIPAQSSTASASELYNAATLDPTTGTFLVGPDVLAAFTGLGTIDLKCIGAGASTATGPGNVSSTFSTSAGCGIDIVYTYEGEEPPVDPVPEPLTILGSLAAVGFGAALKKKVA